MSDIPKAMQYVEAIQREIDTWRSQQQEKGGQSVGPRGYQFGPSVAQMLEWHLREIRAALAEPATEVKPTGYRDAAGNWSPVAPSPEVKPTREGERQRCAYCNALEIDHDHDHGFVPPALSASPEVKPTGIVLPREEGARLFMIKLKESMTRAEVLALAQECGVLPLPIEPAPRSPDRCPQCGGEEGVCPYCECGNPLVAGHGHTDGTWPAPSPEVKPTGEGPCQHSISKESEKCRHGFYFGSTCERCIAECQGCRVIFGLAPAPSTKEGAK